MTAKATMKVDPIVGHRNRDQIPRDFGLDRELARLDEGVVGGLEVRCVVPPHVGTRERGREQNGAYEEGERAAQQAPPRLVAVVIHRGRLRLCLRCRHPALPPLLARTLPRRLLGPRGIACNAAALVCFARAIAARPGDQARLHLRLGSSDGKSRAQRLRHFRLHAPLIHRIHSTLAAAVLADPGKRTI
jgi:hypothetical protein